MGLIDQFPSEYLEDRLDEGLFKALLASVVLYPVPLLFPEFDKSRQRLGCVLLVFAPFRFKWKALFQPVARKKLVVSYLT